MARRPGIPSVRRTLSAIAQTVIVAGALSALACGGGGEPGDTVVANVGDETITAQDVARFMKGAGRGANRESVRQTVETLVDLRLVSMRARDHLALTGRDSLRMKEWREILLVNQFREDVVWKEVAVDEAKLREWYDDNVSEEVQVRHILLRVPPTASEEQKAEAEARADSIRQAIEEGADMAELARQYSDDGSAERGGLLGWTGRGQWVEPFENAAFSTPEGELAPVVKSQFGYHVLRVEGKRKPSYEDLHDEIEEQVMFPERRDAEQAYVQNLMENSGVEFHEQNVDRFIGLVRADPQEEPSDDARELPLATYQGGRITLGELWDIYRALPEGNQRAIGRLDQAGMIQALSTLVQQRLLLDRAKTADVTLDTTRQRQLDERIDQMYIEQYLREVAEARLEVPDSLVAQYYDSHREFYSGQPLEEVREQIRTVLQTQRMQAMQQPDAQMQLVEAVADSQADDVEVEIHEDGFDDVLQVLRGLYEEEGTEPPQESAAPAGAQPAPQGAQPVPQGAQPVPGSTPSPATPAPTGGAAPTGGEGDAATP